MSVGGIFGAVVGGIVGFFIPGGGWLLGAKLAAVGFVIGTAIDPMTPDIKSVSPVQDLQLPSNEIGNPIYDALGTVKVVGGQLLCHGQEKSYPQYVKTGGKGGSSKKQVTGYEYSASWAIGICLGPVDTLLTVFKDGEEVVWEGECVRPTPGLGGSEEILLNNMGAMRFFFGTDDQEGNPDVGEIIGDATLNIPWRGLCWAFFGENSLGSSNRIPTMSFVFRKTPVIAFSNKHAIQIYDCNPMHVVWYIAAVMAGLPETWLHEDDFESVALKLYVENRGISILFDRPQSVATLLEAINSHIDSILRYGSNGKFHPKLIRNDYNVATLPSIDESMMVDKPTFTRKSWIDTVNEMKVQFSEIIGIERTWRGLIAWYKVDEGSGLILYNSAPSSRYKLPDLNIVVKNDNFWSQEEGFGYWDKTTTKTQAYRQWVSDPVYAFTGNIGTIICFGKSQRGLASNVGPIVYRCFNNIPPNHSFWWSAIDANVGVTYSSAEQLVILVPKSTADNHPFISVFKSDGITPTGKIKFADGPWHVGVMEGELDFFDYSSGIYIGCDKDNLGEEDFTWMGTLGDLMIFNVLLTDDEITEIVTVLGPRWGIS